MSSKQTTEGKICFIHKSSDPKSLSFNGVHEFKPVEAALLLFPSWLMHTIYPFRGEGERRSVAFNYDCEINSLIERSY